MQLSNISTNQSICIAVPLRILPGKVSKINKQCEVFKDKWNRMLFALKVGHRHLCTERNFLLLRREQSLNSTMLAIGYNVLF